MAITFIPNNFQCDITTNPNFFHSAAYTNNSFTMDWGTKDKPYSKTFVTPVYQLVLNKYNIPIDFSNGIPSLGHLPGMDIKKMNAIDAIRLSLTEGLVNEEWWDIYEDGTGGVYFQNVLGNNVETVALDIRFCMPTSTKTNQVDMVIVSGYDPPPTVEVLPFKDVVPAGLGEVNPVSITGQEDLFTVYAGDLLKNTRHGNLASSTAVKSYRDPVIVESYGGQENAPFYDVKAFEKVLGYVVDIDGMPTDPVEAAKISYQFQSTTTWYKKISFPNFLHKTDYADGPAETTDASYFEAKVTDTSPLYSDRYNSPWPLYIRPVDIAYTGNKIVSVTQVPIPATVSFFYALLQPMKEFVSMSMGSAWTWERSGTLDYDFYIYFQPTFNWANLVPFLTSGGARYKLLYVPGDTTTQDAPAFTAWQPKLLGHGGGLGYAVDDMYIGWEIDRPSVLVEHKTGSDALEIASKLRIRYAPIIETDKRAPIAYKHRIAGESIVDLTDALADTDPTTCQNLQESQLDKMEELSEGNVIKTSLPFCATGAECLKVAKTIYDYMSHDEVQTYSLTCGPDSNVKLGAAVEGFNSNLRIDSINYSYQDSSSYTIEVSLKPVFSAIGSWSINSAVRATEEVSRPAVVTWSAGDGTNYKVDVKGLGPFYAVNCVKGGNRMFYVGDTVDVTLYNVPREK